MNELYSISKIASITGRDRRTVAARLAAITPAKESANLKQYSVKQIFELAFYDARAGSAEPLTPVEELAYWNARLKELEYKKRIGEVCEASDVARQFSLIAKGMQQPYVTMADEAEADGMPPKWVLWIENKIKRNMDVSSEMIAKDEEQDDVRESE